MNLDIKPDDMTLQSLNLPPLLKKLSPTECCQLAYSCALKGAGHTQSNPLVGAVFVDSSHRFLGCGGHESFGGKHAEKKALDAVISNGLDKHLENGLLYCTLEPCSHQGKTPPCSELIATLPIKKVIYGCIDPNPIVSGEGITKIQASGITCQQDLLLKSLCQRLTERFFWNQKTQTPFVGLKAAISLDGMIAKHGSTPSWITGQRARNYGRWLRQIYDAIVVGADTVIADNPLLTPRLPWFSKQRTPTRLVFDPNARALFCRPIHEQRLLKDSPETVVWIVGPGGYTSILKNKIDKKVEDTGIQLKVQETNSGGSFDLNNILSLTWNLGITSLLLEGGRKVWSCFLAENRVQKLHLFQAPVILGQTGHSFWADDFSRIANVRQLQDLEMVNLDGDWLIEGKFQISEICWHGN